MWEAMSQIFGYSWDSQRGAVDGGTFKTWLPTLKRLTMDQIAKGVNKCGEWTGDFPPNLGRFVELCTAVETKPLDYLQFALDKQKRLAAPKPDKAKGRTELADIKKELGL